jgi:hypothetical protein
MKVESDNARKKQEIQEKGQYVKSQYGSSDADNEGESKTVVKERRNEASLHSRTPARRMPLPPLFFS